MITRAVHWIAGILLVVLAPAELLAGDSIGAAVLRELSKRYADTTIVLSSPIQWKAGQAAESVSSVEILSESSRGDIDFRTDSGAEGSTTFGAWKDVWISRRRILPGERLQTKDFAVQKINVATGMAREVRGLILGKESELSTLEARQTVLEGQFVLGSAVQRVPDVRRGEAVRVRLMSGDVAISTPGTAEEPAYMDQQVRVMTQKSKRVLLGTLRKDGVVEVNL